MRSKSQIPKSKLQRNPKLQFSNNFLARFGLYLLVLGASLGFGTWDLRFLDLAPAPQQVTLLPWQKTVRQPTTPRSRATSSLPDSTPPSIGSARIPSGRCQ